MQTSKKLLMYLLVFGLFLVPFIAFLVPNTMFFPFISGKGFAFRILVEVLFGLYVILAFVDRESRPKLSWVSTTVLFFGVAVFVADLLGVNVYKSLWSNYERMEGFVLVLHLVMYYFVASSVFRTKAKWNQFFNVSIITSVIMSLYGVLQLLGKVTINQGGVRVDATFGNASYFAIYLVLNIFLAIYMLSGTKAIWQKWGYGLAVLLEVIVLYFTATRGAILGLIGGLLVTGLLLAWKEKENNTVRKWAYTTVIAVLILVVGFVALRSTSLVQTSPVLSRFASLGVTEFEGQGRYFIWPMALRGVLDRPIFGWGQENFNFVFNKYYNPSLFGQEEWFDRTHDVFLDWLVAGGIVGFLAYASMYVALFYYIWRRKSVLKSFEKSILTGGLLAYIFHNIFVFDNLISYILFFSILAYIHSVSVEKEEAHGKFYTKVFSGETVAYVVLVPVFVLTAGMIYFVNVPALTANLTLIQAITPKKEGASKNLELFKDVYSQNSFGSTEATEQLVQITSQLYTSQVSDATKADFYNLSKLKIEEKIAQTPHDARYLVFAGSFYNRFRQYDEAIKYLERAIVESPKKETIYFELGTSYIAKGDYQKAFEFFKQSYDFNPNANESKIIYTVGAIYARKADVIKEMATHIAPATVISDERFLRAYADTGDYNSVMAILNARLQKDPTNVQNRLTLASVYAKVGQKQKAISIIQAIINSQPDFKAQGEGYIKEIQAM